MGIGLDYDLGIYFYSLIVEVRDLVYIVMVNVLIFLMFVNDNGFNVLVFSVDVREDMLIGVEIVIVFVIDSDVYLDNVY